MSVTVAVVQPKGGAGKTTATVLLALALAHRGVKIAVVDFDPSAATSQWLSAHPHPNIALRADPEHAAGDELIQLIDSEGKSRFEQVLKALPEVDLFLIPCSASPLEVAGAKTAVQYIREHRPKRTLIRLLWNRLNTRATNAQPETLAQQASEIGTPAFAATIPRSEAFADASSLPWTSLRVEHREMWENTAIELMGLLLKGK